MLLRKDGQKVPKGLVFVQTAILSSPGTKILNDFDRIEIYIQYIHSDLHYKITFGWKVHTDINHKH